MPAFNTPSGIPLGSINLGRYPLNIRDIMHDSII
jgi:hypothetical protein